VAVDTRRHLIAGVVTGRGPGPDIVQLPEVMGKAWMKAQIDTVMGDADDDAAWAHVWMREDLGVKTLIPPRIGRPTRKPPSGKWRRWMSEQLEETTDYGQRWQVETVFSMIKRNLGDTLSGRSEAAQCNDLNLLAITHNVMVLLRSGRFATEQVRNLFPGGDPP